ncbi:MAG: ferritin family protein [Thermoplasmata archaeon]
MDLTEYNMEDMLLSALKSEVEAKKAYLIMASRVKNAFLKDKLEFLATQEEKHRETLESVFRETLGGKEIVLPKETPVPLPSIVLPDEKSPLSIVLESAMKAEKAAYEFYSSLSDRFEDPNMKATVTYLASMETGHYKLLEIEKEIAERFEEYDEY